MLDLSRTSTQLSWLCPEGHYLAAGWTFSSVWGQRIVKYVPQPRPIVLPQLLKSSPTLGFSQPWPLLLATENSGGLSGVLYSGGLLLMHYQWKYYCLWAQKNNSKDNQIITFTKNKRKFCLIQRNIQKAQSDILVKERNPAIYIQNKTDRHMTWAWTKRPKAANTSNTRRWPFKSPEMGGEKKGSHPWDFICNIDVMSCSLVPRGSSNG